MSPPAEAELPEGGAWRVHPDPPSLPGRPGPDEVPPNRFDDPDGVYRVRYLATSKRGAFLEVLSRFRRDDETDARLAEVRNVDADDAPVTSFIPRAYLGALRQARCWSPGARFIDVADPLVQSVLDRHPRVRLELDASGLGSPNDPVDLDEATIRLGGKVGRPITQAISRIVFDETDAAGIHYTSRLDVTEECWAVFEATSVEFSDPEPIQFDDPALRSAVGTLGLMLPS